MAFHLFQGKTACRDDGQRCLTCVRTLVEIQLLRDLLDQLCTMTIEYNYDNVDEVTAYIARKLPTKIACRRKNYTMKSNTD